MIYLLDTDICIYTIKKTFSALPERIQSHDPEEIGITSMVKAELYFGAFKSQAVEKSVSALDFFLSPFQIIPFGDPEAMAYARLRASLEKKVRPIGPNDFIIAAIALARNAVIVTHNTREFNRIDGLQVEDWTL